MLITTLLIFMSLAAIMQQLASDLDIDHVVPLAHAHRTGGANWLRRQKRQFANDPGNLIAVDDRTNQEKGDKEPVRWKPPA